MRVRLEKFSKAFQEAIPAEASRLRFPIVNERRIPKCVSFVLLRKLTHQTGRFWRYRNTFCHERSEELVEIVPVVKFSGLLLWRILSLTASISIKAPWHGKRGSRMERRQFRGYPRSSTSIFSLKCLALCQNFHASEAVDTCHVEAVMHSVQLLYELQGPCRSVAAYPNSFIFLHAGFSSLVMNF